jgi:hypothetical protein
MDWIEWLGIGLAAWLALSLTVGLGLTRVIAITP